MEPLSLFIGLPEKASILMTLLFLIKLIVACIGVLVIVTGAFMAIYQFAHACHTAKGKIYPVDLIRLRFGKMIVLGLEFIVAADMIETITAPDYYSVGILAALVGIRTLLTFFMNRELETLAQRK